ncbi:hypothetical protein BMG523Draft_01273 [Frankia sp. BMG5.23]|nr:hypothetical protein BMG523Draft_01273 [Frankia sp. BMG5.23]
MIVDSSALVGTRRLKGEDFVLTDLIAAELDDE